MSAQSGLVRLLFAPVMFWVLVMIGGTYFMVSFDEKAMREAKQESSFTGYFKKMLGSMRLAGINKGIDIAGGTYLVLGVEVEKALENRLALENRSLDQLLTSKGLKTLPTSKTFNDGALELIFADEEVAKSCFNIIKEHRGTILNVKRSGVVVRATLTSDIDSALRVGAVEQAVNVLSTRLGNYGVEGNLVQQHGARQVVVQLPGLDDPDRVKAIVQKTAHLELKLVEESAAKAETLLDKFDGDLPQDKMIVPGRSDEGEPRRYFLVSAFPDMTGEHITDSRVEFDQYGKAQVGFVLDSVGADEFADITSNNVGKHLGIVIDNVMFSDPVIQGAIPGGKASITNIASQKEALDLSIVLRSGSLVAPLKFEQENRVGAKLGQDSVHKGIFSCLVALLLLFVFSIFYYKIPGLFAVFALMLNLFLILLFLSYFNATLTLPGIAGMVVSIGMGIDASILIYENIREHIAAGVPLRVAIDNGFKGVMPVILDSNITTFLTGAVLFYFGGPAIKGFAVTLMMGIVATILSGVYFLKSLFSFTMDRMGVRSIRF
ncbi:protein translocase subunit SecD [Candidatus Babeliales bacterium]|nr:protein translocase subunit SecD [Candidatus Babeliales bacterium]MBY0353549.1 protein translocase subunit SecD [Candidatus Babeliales bacterium]